MKDKGLRKVYLNGTKINDTRFVMMSLSHVTKLEHSTAVVGNLPLGTFSCVSFYLLFWPNQNMEIDYAVLDLDRLI